MQDVIVITENATIPYTVKWIKRLTLQAAAHPEIKQVAKEARASDNVLKFVFDYAYDRIIYEPNEGKKQQLRTVWNFLREHKGNCTIYSILIGAVLLNLGIPYRYRVVSYPEFDKITGKQLPPTFGHIYINTKDGVTLDPVIGHKQDGTDTRYNRPEHGQFNKELHYIKKIDYPMSRLEILNGTLGKHPQFRHIVTNRSRMARYGILAGCSCQGLTPEHAEVLGKTIFGKILKKVGNTVADVGHVVANTIVSPVEAMTGKQIVGPNYHGAFASAIDKATSAVVSKAVNVAGSMFTAGTITGKNPYQVAADKKAAADQAAADVAAQQQFEQLNALSQQQQGFAPPQPQQAGMGMPMIIGAGLLLGGLVFMGKGGKK